MKRFAGLFALLCASNACSMLLGLDDAEFDPSFESDQSGGESGSVTDASAGMAGAVAGSAGAGGATEP